jgi:hypothetical protein
MRNLEPRAGDANRRDLGLERAADATEDAGGWNPLDHGYDSLVRPYPNPLDVDGPSLTSFLSLPRSALGMERKREGQKSWPFVTR